MSKSENSPEPLHHLLSLQHHPPVAQMSQQQLQEFMSKLKAASLTLSEERQFPTYTIVVDLYSNARSLVYGVDLELIAMVGEFGALKEFNRFVRRPVSSDVCEMRLMKDLGTPEEECLANAHRTNGFAVVTNPES